MAKALNHAPDENLGLLAQYFAVRFKDKNASILGAHFTMGKLTEWTKGIHSIIDLDRAWPDNFKSLKKIILTEPSLKPVSDKDEDLSIMDNLSKYHSYFSSMSDKQNYQQLLSELRAKILTVTETWYKESSKNQDSLAGFTLYGDRNQVGTLSAANIKDKINPCNGSVEELSYEESIKERPATNKTTPFTAQLINVDSSFLPAQALSYSLVNDMPEVTVCYENIYWEITNTEEGQFSRRNKNDPFRFHGEAGNTVTNGVVKNHGTTFAKELKRIGHLRVKLRYIINGINVGARVYKSNDLFKAYSDYDNYECKSTKKNIASAANCRNIHWLIRKDFIKYETVLSGNWFKQFSPLDWEFDEVNSAKIELAVSAYKKEKREIHLALALQSADALSDQKLSHDIIQVRALIDILYHFINLSKSNSMTFNDELKVNFHGNAGAITMLKALTNSSSATKLISSHIDWLKLMTAQIDIIESLLENIKPQVDETPAVLLSTQNALEVLMRKLK
jgi:hypothetical protein